MTQTLARPRSLAADPTLRRKNQPDEPVASVWIRGAFAALSCAAVGVATLVVIVLGVWAADARSGASAGTAIRFAIDIWLLAHWDPLHVPGATIAMAPLGITMLVAILIGRATAIVARGSRAASLRDLVTNVLAVTVPYAVITTVLAIVGRTSHFHVSPVGAAISGLLVAGLAGGVGALRGSPERESIVQLLPGRLTTSMRLACDPLLVIAAAACLLVVASVAMHTGAERHLLTSDGGISAQLTTGALSLLLLPNAAGFATSYVVGPGFALGAGTSVSYTGSHIGRLPALPLLAAAPHTAPTWATAGCIAIAISAGLVLGVRTCRSALPSIAEQLMHVGAAAGITAVTTAVLCGLSGGSVGPGRMTTFGPSAWRAGLIAGAEVGMVAALVVLAWTWVRLARELAQIER